VILDGRASKSGQLTADAARLELPVGGGLAVLLVVVTGDRLAAALAWQEHAAAAVAKLGWVEAAGHQVEIRDLDPLQWLLEQEVKPEELRN